MNYCKAVRIENADTNTATGLIVETWHGPTDMREYPACEDITDLEKPTAMEIFFPNGNRFLIVKTSDYEGDGLLEIIQKAKMYDRLCDFMGKHKLTDEDL